MRPLTSPRRWERPALFGSLLLVALLAGASALWDTARLNSMGVPWAYAGATLDPRLVPTLTPSPSPTLPIPTSTPRPTVASLGRTCADDPLILERVQPKLGTVIKIGKTLLAATARYCLGSREQAYLGIGLIPWGEGVEPVFIQFAELKVVPAGEGSLTQGIQWGEFVFDRPPPPPGTYRFVAVLVDEFGTLLASTSSEDYTFVEVPTPTPFPSPTP